MKKTMRKILAAALVLMLVLAMLPAAFAATLISPAPMKLDFWVSDANTYAVTANDDGTYTITYNGGGSTYACAGAPVADYANGNDTLTVTVTNNGTADSRVRFDVQATTQVGNTQTCNVSATGGDVWTDLDWGGSTLTVPAGQSVDVTVTYDANSERGAVTNLVVFVDSGRGDGETYNANVTLSKIKFTTAPKDPAADSTLSVADAIALGTSKEHNVYTEGKYYVTGVITEVYNTQYGNMKIADEAGNILTVYGTYSADGSARYDKLDVKPVAGDTVTVYGIIGQYNGTPQVKNGWITAHTPAAPAEPEPETPTESTDPAADSTLSVADAIALGTSKEHNVYTEGKYYVTGVITEVYNETYGNMKIADADGNILTVYGTYSADGSARYDKLESKPTAGCVVTVYGIIGQYNGTPQIKNGWIVSFDPAADSTLSVADAIALGASKSHNVYTSAKYYVTGVITEVYNAQYGNMKITDENGNILTVYGTYSADGETRYDKLDVQPVAGDTVTVYGIIGQYKDAPQMKNGWITAHAPAASSDPDPVDPQPDPVDPPAPTGTTYVVKAGDTLGKIALAHYGIVEKYQAIFEANRGILTDPNTIYVGQVLTLPEQNLLTAGEGETLYTIQPGDTLGKIALNWYGTMTQYKVIFERNATHLASPDLIYAGQVIVLPAK